MFKISDLANEVVYNIDGDLSLATRRPLPIAATDENFQIYRIPYAMRIDTVSVKIYNDPGLWALIAEWNSLPSPAQYFTKYLQAGLEMRYLPLSTYRKYLGCRKPISLAGCGSVDLSIDINREQPTPELPNNLMSLIFELEATGLDFIEFGI